MKTSVDLCLKSDFCKVDLVARTGDPGPAWKERGWGVRALCWNNNIQLADLAKASKFIISPFQFYV